MYNELVNQNKKLAHELLYTQKKLVICLQGLDALSGYDHTGIVKKILEELDRADNEHK